ncbi:MAG: hypothetical protein ACRCT8_12055 [Lacipirellulaceae bacterium]
MSTYTFDPTATNRYVRADATGSGDGTANSASGAWTIAQYAAASAANAIPNFDAWVVGVAGTIAVTSPIVIASGGDWNQRGHRTLGCWSAPGDLSLDVADAQRPRIVGTGGAWTSGQYVFSNTSQNAVVANLDLSLDASQVANVASVGQNSMFVSCTAFMAATLGRPLHAYLSTVYRCRATGGFGVEGNTINCFLRTLAYNGNVSTVVSDSIIDGLIADRPIFLNRTFVRTYFQGQRRTAVRSSIGTVTTDKTTLRETMVQAADASPSFTKNGCDMGGNRFSQPLALVNMAANNFRLTDHGRKDRVAVEAMIANLDTPLPAVSSRDSAATLYQYLAELDSRRLNNALANC